MSAARNTGFEAARSEFVVQLDSDDLLEPTAVEKWWWCLATHPDLAFCKGFTVIFGGKERLWHRGFHSGSAFLARNQTEPTAMIRRQVHRAVGGYDVAIRDGLEDWDFWLRCADAGFWGGTVPEFLGWHRWRSESGPRPWKNWDEGPRQRSFRRRLRQSHPSLWRDGIPERHPETRQPVAESCPVDPVGQPLEAAARGHTLVCATDAGGTGGAALDRLGDSLGDSRVTIAVPAPVSDAELRRFEERTADTFVLPHFLPRREYVRFLEYLVRSRRIGTILVGSDLAGDPVLARLEKSQADLRFIHQAGRTTSPTIRDSPGGSGWALTADSDLDASLVLRPPSGAKKARVIVYRWLVVACDPAHRWLLRRGGRAYEALTDPILRWLLRG